MLDLLSMPDEPMERTVTIRFSHIDDASIVFYPRYFEILSELFAELPFAEVPFAMQTDFLKPNILGDQLNITYDTNPSSGDWAFTGRMGDAKHFTIASLPQEERKLDRFAHCPDQPAFRSDAIRIAPWASDCTGYLQVSRYYELLNAAVEQWFPRTLATTYYEFHVANRFGMPTVKMRTQCRELPRVGDSVTIWIRPTTIGQKSLTYTCWMVRGDECLLQNDQTIVFVKVNGADFQTIPIPDEMRTRLQEQYVAA
jgi:4-hydroxybenzoyl-CoA thioesterase